MKRRLRAMFLVLKLCGLGFFSLAPAGGGSPVTLELLPGGVAARLGQQVMWRAPLPLTPLKVQRQGKWLLLSDLHTCVLRRFGSPLCA